MRIARERKRGGHADLDFIDRLSSDVPVHPLSLDIARLAGRIDADQEAKGVQLVFDDLLIGATA